MTPRRQRRRHSFSRPIRCTTCLTASIAHKAFPQWSSSAHLMHRAPDRKRCSQSIPPSGLPRPISCTEPLTGNSSREASPQCTPHTCVKCSTRCYKTTQCHTWISRKRHLQRICTAVMIGDKTFEAQENPNGYTSVAQRAHIEGRIFRTNLQKNDTSIFNVFCGTSFVRTFEKNDTSLPMFFVVHLSYEPSKE